MVATAGFAVAALDIIHPESGRVTIIRQTRTASQGLRDAASVAHTAGGDAPEEFAQFTRAEIPKWAQVVKTSGARARLAIHQALPVMLSWMTAEAESTRAVMGAEFWPYGIEADRDIIDTQIRRSRQQGLIPRRLAIEEPFAPA
jgi:hypothetical protein